MDGEGGISEELEAEGGDPVGEWGFFEVADAVDVEGDEVSGVEHGLGGLGVGGVGVVEEWRGGEGCGEDGEPEGEEKQDVRQRPARGGFADGLSGCGRRGKDLKLAHESRFWWWRDKWRRLLHLTSRGGSAWGLWKTGECK